MARQIVSRIFSALTQEWSGENVHFHAHGGRPYACYDRSCTSPRFDAG